MGRALVVYSTRTGETRSIGELIAGGIRMGGQEADVRNATEIKKEEDLQGYDAHILGSATYHGEMMNGMKTLLFLAEKAGLQGKVGGAYGAFGWSGEAPERIFDTMKNVFGMEMVSGPLRLKSATLGGVTTAQDYGREISRKMTRAG